MQLATWAHVDSSAVISGRLSIASVLQPELAALDAFMHRALPAAIHGKSTLCHGCKLGCKPGLALTTASRTCCTARAPIAHVTQSEVSTVMKWKLMRGKFRPGLQKYVDGLSKAAVVDASTASFRLAAAGRLKAAVVALSEPLKGVGPATASAILAAAFPAACAFMSDEALALIVPAGSKPKYSADEAVELSRVLSRVAAQLQERVPLPPVAGASGGGPQPQRVWTPQDVQQAIWAAAHLPPPPAPPGSIIAACRRLAAGGAAASAALPMAVEPTGAGEALASTSALGKRRR
jgi:hypothetical protein